MAKRGIIGKRALVTGASSGIGREIARELARQGADMVVVARRLDRLRELAAEISAAGRRIEPIAGDVTDPSVRREAIATARDRLGGLDILVNNAGVGALGEFAEAEPDRLRRIMEVNFFAVAELTREALPLLAAGNQPIVVNIGSILGHRAMPRSSEYCASKFALRGLSESLRAELLPRGVDVLLVSPATTETEFFDSLIERKAGAAWRSPRVASPESVARATVRGICRGSREVFPDASSRLVYWLNRLAPSIVDRVLANR